jgi:SAM-dependent methyltransferase
LSFYTRFAAGYERIFPFREGTHAFLRTHLPPPPGKVLDAGCGTGHYCGRLAADSYEATGVDLDAAMIAEAHRAHPEASFAVADVRDATAWPEALDGAFCIGNVISHITADDRLLVAQSLRERVCPGGVWILQTVNWDRILADGRQTFPPISAGEDESTVFEREYRDLSPDTVRFVTRLREGDRILFEGETTLHPMPLAEAVGSHEAAGWRLRGAYGDFQGTAHDRSASPATILVLEGVTR